MSSIVSISNLPAANTILSTDKFYIFSKEGNSFIKNEISINDLSAFFYDKTTVEKLDKKYKDLLKLSSDFVSFLKNTFPTMDYVSSHYSTLSHFNDVYNSIETVDSVQANYFNDYYVTFEYEQFLKNETKAKCAEVKMNYLNDSGMDIFYTISPRD